MGNSIRDAKRRHLKCAEKRSKMRTVLITGVCGLIGSHLAEELLASGQKVIGIDNLHSGKMQNLDSFVNHPNFEFHVHDVTTPYDFEVDFIYNLACPASPVHYQDDPVRTIRTNVLGAINALELAKKFNCGVLQASTSEVYGDPLESPQKESYLGNVNPIGIRACYDEGKRVAETLFFDYHRQYRVEIKVVRIFNTYGPRMKFDDGRVVSNFIIQGLTGKPLTIYGSGTQTRSFCFVTDLVQGLLKVANTEREFTGPVNIGNPGEFSIRELAMLVKELMGTEIDLVEKGLPSDDPKVRQPDITLAKSALNWEPTIDIRLGLARTIEDFKSRIASGEL